MFQRMSVLNPPAPDARPIRFWHEGAVRELTGVHPTRSLLDWLREDAHCSGTKEGCNEGDCGACTVVLGELDAAAPGGLRLDTVNACTRFVPTVDGRAVFTVQDVAAVAGADAQALLHPVQQSLVDCHGSQCGFCTPGFVMSMWHAYEAALASGVQPTRQQMADALAGNLCRCTGYRPILEAAERMFDAAPVRLDRAPVVQALKALADAPSLSFAATNAANRLDHYTAPRSLDALADALQQRPEARLLAGATDIGLWVNKQFRDLGDIVYLGDVPELQRIEQRDGCLSIGAGASLERAWAALAQVWPTLTEVWLRFASPPVRHAGTMGGNIANGSPIGDSAPVLMALDATLLLRCGAQTRRMALADFYTGYMKNRLQPSEFVQAIEVPLPEAPAHDASAWQVCAYKVSKRYDSDISALCAGLALRLDAAGSVADVRIAFGGMAATVARARHAEAALRGQPWTEASCTAAAAALATDYQPITDLRASAAYRQRVAANLLRRFWLETRLTTPGAAPAGAHGLRVFVQREAALRRTQPAGAGT
jgi:xanthine dehydrogenase small subunit